MVYRTSCIVQGIDWATHCRIRVRHSRQKRDRPGGIRSVQSVLSRHSCAALSPTRSISQSCARLKRGSFLQSLCQRAKNRPTAERCMPFTHPHRLVKFDQVRRSARCSVPFCLWSWDPFCGAHFEVLCGQWPCVKLADEDWLLVSLSPHQLVCRLLHIQLQSTCPPFGSLSSVLASLVDPDAGNQQPQKVWNFHVDVFSILVASLAQDWVKTCHFCWWSYYASCSGIVPTITVLAWILREVSCRRVDRYHGPENWHVWMNFGPSLGWYCKKAP